MAATGLSTDFAMPRSATALLLSEVLKDTGVERLEEGCGVGWEERVALGVRCVVVIGLVLVKDIVVHVSSRRASTKTTL